jgi:hypothetical protein
MNESYNNPELIMNISVARCSRPKSTLFQVKNPENHAEQSKKSRTNHAVFVYQ